MSPLRRLRLDLDATVHELAFAAGIHRDTIRRIEGCFVTPSVETNERLLAGLEVLTGRVPDDEHGALTLGLPRLQGLA